MAVVLGAVSYIRNPPERQDEIVDLGVYSLIYGAWIIFCAPMLLATLNVRLVLQTMHIVARVSTRSVPSVNPFFNVRLVFQTVHIVVRVSSPLTEGKYPFFNVKLGFQIMGIG